LPQGFGSLRTSLLINAVFPLLIYLVASPHLAQLAALALTAVSPVLYGCAGWLRTRRADPLNLLALVLIALGMLLALLGHDPRLFLMRDSLATGAFGLLCLLSLPFARPLAYYLYRWVFVRTPDQLARLNAGWQVPYASFVRRLITAVWGVVFLGEALVDTFLLYHLPMAHYVAIHPVLFWGTQVGAFGWAILYARAAEPKVQASLRQMANGQVTRTATPRPEAAKNRMIIRARPQTRHPVIEADVLLPQADEEN
jgi:hypothetical protein